MQLLSMSDEQLTLFSFLVTCQTLLDSLVHGVLQRGCSLWRISADLLQNVLEQLKFLMLTKPDRKEGQGDTGSWAGVESDGGGDGRKAGCRKGGGGA